MKGANFTAERMVEEYLAYLFKTYPGNRHSRRVAGWLGLLVLGVDKIKTRWWVSHTRQMCFETNGKRYKVKFDHMIGTQGGIAFVEVAPTPGQPEIRVTTQIPDLAAAASFYRRPRV